MDTITMNYYEIKSKYRIFRLFTTPLVAVISVSLLLLSNTTFSEAAANVKWQPGHYMRFNLKHSEQNIRKFLSNQYTKGILIEIPWRDLEPRVNDYNFSKIEKYLKIVSQYKKYLMINIEVTCFNSRCQHANAPEYIQQNGGVMSLIRPNGTVKGSVVRLWDKNNIERISRLFEAIGLKYDNNRRIVGVMLPGESAISMGGKNRGGYSAEKYVRQLKNIATAMHDYMPKTIGFIGMNFLPHAKDKVAAFNRIAQHLVNNAPGGITHPDTIPSGYDIPSYQVERKFNKKLAIAAQFQTWIIRKNISEENIYRFATNSLGAHFVIWNQHFSSRQNVNRPNYISRYVLPVVNKYKGRTPKAIPSSYRR
jgi:hypothetical protein